MLAESFDGVMAFYVLEAEVDSVCWTESQLVSLTSFDRNKILQGISLLPLIYRHFLGCFNGGGVLGRVGGGGREETLASEGGGGEVGVLYGGGETEITVDLLEKSAMVLRCGESANQPKGEAVELGVGGGWTRRCRFVPAQSIIKYFLDKWTERGHIKCRYY